MQFDDPSFFGTVTFGEPQAVQLAFPGDPKKTVTVTCEHGEWRPPDRLVPFLPDDFSLPLDCYRGSDRLRHIVPLCTFEELIDVGAVGGLAVRHGIRGFDKGADDSFHSMFLIHQHVRGRAYGGTRGMKEHLTREFDYSRDLYVRRLGRTTDDQRNVLPDDVGLNNHGEGHRLSVGQLTENGRRAAVKAGYRNPTSKHAIAFGLFQAAQLNPLEVQPEGVPALVRMALFDVDPSKDVPSEKLLELVKERLLEAIDSHLLDTQEEFDRWFVEPGNSLIKQIAQQKRKRGGELRRGEVRGALLHLGWEAYGYVGQCVHALMRTVKNSMPDPLDDKEKRLFEQMHEGQPCFGDLPLALLAERSSFLRRAVLTIWHEPDDPNHVRILHRLLSYYSDVSRKRREADRQSKQASQHGLHASSDDIGTIGQAREERAEGKTAIRRMADTLRTSAMAARARSSKTFTARPPPRRTLSQRSPNISGRRIRSRATPVACIGSTTGRANRRSRSRSLYVARASTSYRQSPCPSPSTPCTPTKYWSGGGRQRTAKNRAARVNRFPHLIVPAFFELFR